MPKGYKYAGKSEYLMACTVDDVHYNSADPRHFDCLHKKGDFLGNNTWGEYKWEIDATDKSIGRGCITGILDFKFAKVLCGETL